MVSSIVHGKYCITPDAVIFCGDIIITNTENSDERIFTIP